MELKTTVFFFILYHVGYYVKIDSMVHSLIFFLWIYL